MEENETRETPQKVVPLEFIGKVDFRWFSLKKRGDRVVPIMAVVGREFSAPFAFANMTEHGIDSLEISVVASPHCEYDICQCSEDAFRREVRYESRFGGLFRTIASSHRITHCGDPVPAQSEVTGWVRVKFKRLEGSPVIKLEGVPVDFVPVALTLRADYSFQGDVTRYSKTLRAEEVTFAQKGSAPERVVRKLRDEWMEFVAVAVFGWAMGLLSPTLLGALKSLWSMIVAGLFR